MDRIQEAIEKARAKREARDAADAAAVLDPRPEPPRAQPVTQPRPIEVDIPPRPSSSGVATPPSQAHQPEPDPAPIPPPAGQNSTLRAPQFHITDPQPIWQSLTPFKPNRKKMRRNRIVTYDRSQEAHIYYDMMRTRLLRALRKNNWTSVAITSPTSNCGKTTTSANLAFSLGHQKDTRTVLMDVDLSHPRMASMLGLKETHSMARVLDGTGIVEHNFVRCGETLAIGTNERPSRYPAEILQDRAAAEALEKMRNRLQPDVIIYDIPPMAGNDHVMAFLPHVDCVLLVAAAETTTIDEVDRCERELATQTNVLGVILNKCRYLPKKEAYY